MGPAIRMVSKHSAIGKLPRNINLCNPIPVPYDHSEMVKFTSGSDENYITTKNLLKQFLEQAQTVIRNRFSDLGGGGVQNDSADSDRFKALSQASMEGQWGVVELLLKGGFKQNDLYKASYNALQNEFSGTTLHHAASNGYGAMVRLCLDNGEEISSKDSNGWRALHFAAEGGHEAAVQQLLDHAADKEARTNDGSTALHLASAGGHDSTIRFLIEHCGADREARNNNGSTALHLASAGGHDSTIRFLIEHCGADREARNNDGSTALHLASAGGHDSTIRFLIEHCGADREARNNNGSTALHLAASKGHGSTAQLLIRNFGVDKKTEDKNGRTALFSLLCYM